MKENLFLNILLFFGYKCMAYSKNILILNLTKSDKCTGIAKFTDRFC